MEDLVGRLKRGEAEAWREVIVEHYSTVYRFCARRVGLDAAQDATQEAFITIQKKMKSFEEKSSLLTWMMGIAHNHCRNLSRRNRDDVLWLRPEAEVASCENEVINQEEIPPGYVESIKKYFDALEEKQPK